MNLIVNVRRFANILNITSNSGYQISGTLILSEFGPK
jgi:hypothetical protein